MTPYWFPVLTLVLGAIGGYLADALRDTRAARRQREAARDAFQRETLIDLQDWHARLGRAAVSYFHETAAGYDATGQWGRVASATDEAFRDAGTNFMRLRVRLLNEELRNLALDFSQACTQISMAATTATDPAGAAAVAKDAVAELPRLGARLNQLIGERLRELS